MRRWVAVGLVLTGVAGCGGPSGSIEAPSTSLEVGDRPAVSPGAAREIAMILPGGDDGLALLWENVARVESTGRRATLVPVRPAPGAGPGGQAASVRATMTRRPSALIIMAEAGAEGLGASLAEARAAGIPVVLLEVPVEGAGSPPPTLVTFADDAPALTGLAAATLKVANDAGLPPFGPALFVFRDNLGTKGEAQLAGLIRAVEALGVAARPTARYEGYSDKAQAVVAEALKADPTIRLIFGDDQAMTGALAAQSAGRPAPMFALGGVAADRKSLEMIGDGQCAGAIDQNFPALAREAVRVALDLADGRPAPPRVEVPVPLVLANGPPKSRPPQVAPSTPSAPVPKPDPSPGAPPK